MSKKSVGMDSVFADLLADTNKKFGDNKVFSIDELNAHMCGIPCPLAWQYVIGGSDKIPMGRVFGGDGPSKHFKSSVSMEHGVWVLKAGGVVILVDTEEKTSDTLTRSLMYDLDPEDRKRFLYVKATSMEEAEGYVTHFKKRAKEYREKLAPADQFPMLVIWDSLTGSATEGQNEKVDKEGNAAVRQFSEQAMSLSNYYKTLSFDDAFFSLMHVQHAKKSQDQYALKDDMWVPNGGTEPKFKSTFHYRMEKVTDVEWNGWTGKDLKLFMMKSSLGEDHRELTLRILWKHEWVQVPQFDDKGKIFKGEGTMRPEAAAIYFEEVKGALEPAQCEVLIGFLGLDKDKLPEECPKPVTEKLRIQKTWFDWDYSLGHLIFTLLGEKGLTGDEKDELKKIFPITEGNKGFVKSKKLFGDDEPRDFHAFGKFIMETPELLDTLTRFWGITHYQSVKEYALRYDRSKK